ncbi:MAG: YdcF family protein [Bacteroidaceae bacterium]|nr:YdcF family protein [Bacteroidaceae bacterium]
MSSIIFTCDFLVVSYAKDKCFTNVAEIPATKYGLLLGTTPQTRLGKRSDFFKFRIDAAEALYKAKKIERIVISGDENSLDGVNEPECMRDSLVARGVPAEDIILDGKGFRTLDSVVRMSKIFSVNSFTIISQKFHNERALYLATHLDLDVKNVQAFHAKSPTTNGAFITYIREYLARVKMFLDIVMKKEPQTLAFNAEQQEERKL